MYLVQKNESGVWYLVDSVTGPDGKKKKVWRSTKKRDRKEAEAILKEIEASRGLVAQQKERRDIKDLIVERAMAASAVLVQQKTAFDDAWRVYLNDPRTKAMKDSSYARVNVCWKSLCKFVKGKVECVEQFTYEDAVAYINSLKGKLAGGTILLHKTALQSVFSRIRRPLGLPDNPFEDMYVPRPERRTHRCFTRDEIIRIFEALPPDGEWYAIIALSLYTGMRFGDCCTLRAEEIKGNFICREVRKLSRYGSETLTAIHPDLAPILESRRKRYSTGYLFPELVQEYLSKTPSKYFGELLRALGIQRKQDKDIVDFHSFRHTFNTLLIERNVDLGIRLRLTGHSNVKTNQIYNHANKALSNAIKRIPNLLPQIQETQMANQVDTVVEGKGRQDCTDETYIES